MSKRSLAKACTLFPSSVEPLFWLERTRTSFLVLRFARNNFLPTVCVMSEGSGTPAGEHMQTSCQECNPRVITVAPLFGHPCPPATPPRLGLDTIYLTSGDRPAGLRRRWRRPANRTRLQRRHGVPVAAHPHPDQHTRGFTRVVSPSTGEPSRTGAGAGH